MVHHLFNIPVEILRQILFEALMVEIEDRQPYPLGRASLPYDRLLHPIFSRDEMCKLEKQVWGQSSFWGREPMTRLMRVNKRIYAEVYRILWSDFALHNAAWREKKESAVVEWLERYNPRAFESVRHLHLRYSAMPQCDEGSWDYERNTLIGFIRMFPGILSVRFQISICGDRINTTSVQDVGVERILYLVETARQTIQSQDVKIFWEPWSMYPEGKLIVDRCIAELGQGTKLPKLHEEHLSTFPEERRYVNPAFKDVRAETPPPSIEEMRSYFSRDWADVHWPLSRGDCPRVDQ